LDVEEVNLVLEFSGAMGSREWRLDDSLVSELEGTLGHPGYSGSLTWEIEEDSWVPYLDLMIQRVRPEGRRIELKTPGVVSAMLHVMASLGDDRLEEGTAEDDKRS